MVPPISFKFKYNPSNESGNKGRVPRKPLF